MWVTWKTPAMVWFSAGKTGNTTKACSDSDSLNKLDFLRRIYPQYLETKYNFFHVGENQNG